MAYALTGADAQRLLDGLPHREPFVFIRKVISCSPGISAECETTFESDDPMFRGHFPGQPLVPGVIVAEALAQTAGIAAASVSTTDPVIGPPFFLLSAIRTMKFLRAIVPRDSITLRAEKAGEVGSLLQFNVSASVGSEIAVAGQIVLSRAARSE